MVEKVDANKLDHQIRSARVVAAGLGILREDGILMLEEPTSEAMEFYNGIADAQLVIDTLPQQVNTERQED